MKGFKLLRKKIYRKAIAMVLTVAMVICSIPVSAQAAPVSYAPKSDSFTVGDFTVSYNETSQWSNYCVADVNITNNSENTYNSWKLSFNYDGIIDNIWNADIISSENGEYVLLCKDYNSQMVPGQTVNIGFMAYGKESSPNIPTNIKVITDDESSDGSSVNPGTDSSGTETSDEGNNDSDNTETDSTPIIGENSGVPEGLKALNYTIFSGEDNTLDLYTNSTNIIGSVHTIVIFTIKVQHLR